MMKIKRQVDIEKNKWQINGESYKPIVAEAKISRQFIISYGYSFINGQNDESKIWRII